MATMNNMHFTYPVLCNFNDDYINVEFNAGTTGILEKTKKYSKIKTLVDISDEQMVKLVNEKKAKIVIKVYCSSSKYRNIFDVKLGNDELVLKNIDVNNRVELSTFIVLNQNLINYTNDNFNQDYKGKTFSLEKGSILAIGKQENIFIEKDINDLTKLNSIVTICKGDKEDEPLTVSYDDDKIKIKLSENGFNIYSNYSKYCIPILNSMIIIPALTYVLDEIAKEEQDIEEYKEKKWYRVISKKSTNVLGRQFAIEYIRNTGSFELLQKIFDNPIYDSLEMIKNKWNSEVDINDN